LSSLQCSDKGVQVAPSDDVLNKTQKGDLENALT
jgi:hypothetical protein